MCWVFRIEVAISFIVYDTYTERYRLYSLPNHCKKETIYNTFFFTPSKENKMRFYLSTEKYKNVIDI